MQLYNDNLKDFVDSLEEEWKAQVGVDYLARYHLTYDQVLTTSQYDLNMPDPAIQAGNNLGELAADAFLWATEQW